MSTRSPAVAPLARYRLLALAVTVAWSSSWVLIRVGLDDVDAPLTFAGLRYGLAALLLAGWVWRRSPPDRPAPVRRELPALLALGLVQYAITQGAQFVAIARQPLATTSLLLAATPLLVVLGGRLIGEPLTARQLTAGLLIAAGAYVYFQGELGATAVGLAAAAIGLAANAVSALGGRTYNRSTPLSAPVVTVVSMGVGAGALLVAGLVVDGLPQMSWRLVGVVVWLAVVNTAAAFTWWNVCLRHLPATEMAVINTTMSVQIPLLGWIAFGESLGWRESLGLAIVVVAVLLAVTRRAGRATPRTWPTSRRHRAAAPWSAPHRPR